MAKVSKVDNPVIGTFNKQAVGRHHSIAVNVTKSKPC